MRPPASPDALIVVAKHATPGHAKTRLARAIGDAAACRLYAAFVAQIAARFANGPYDFYWAYTPPDAPFAAPPPGAHECFPQSGPDLASRLLHVARWAAGAGYRRWVIMSSDSPQLAPEVVGAAYAALDTAEVALGSAEDGGYYLIGQRQPHDLFTGVEMGTEHVLAQTLDAAARQGLTTALLAPAFDVDTEADLRRLIAWVAGHPRELPILAAALAELDLLPDVMPAVEL